MRSSPPHRGRKSHAHHAWAGGRSRSPDAMAGAPAFESIAALARIRSCGARMCEGMAAG
eukprot:CAMPEP_0176278506 /NCGR_PEP_ID=MMETSP0121_2-20121125/48818_1 /TAXON_ID=160619 /ORGANISM="Kryptoperidinium foliaceum, Strain CCMP 1326" /LENGTH=58 /DNA_ID=CAMNT_0017618819 /DNA_START=56 /DNA_END=229 /DNA_ORIENTATION=+